MSLMLQILVRAGLSVLLVALMACGQQGPLYLPQTEGQRPASLPESLLPAKAAAKSVAPMPPVAIPGTSQLPPSATP